DVAGVAWRSPLPDAAFRGATRRSGDGSVQLVPSAWRSHRLIYLYENILVKAYYSHGQGARERRRRAPPLARSWLRRLATHGAGGVRAGWAQMLARGGPRRRRSRPLSSASLAVGRLWEEGWS